MALEIGPVNYRELIRKVERAVAAIGETEDLRRLVHDLIETVIRELRDELGFFGGRLYLRDGQDYVLQATFADARPLPAGFRVPRTYPPLEEAVMRGVVYLPADDPRLDPRVETYLGVQEFACISLDGGEYILAFDVAPGHERDDILISLGILRHAVDQRLRHERLRDVFREARRIQHSILPQCRPRLGNFDYVSRSEPMESVGGDYYDYIPITDKSLGFAIADVTGHGLPAALQVRDIYTGLRMGLARDFKIVRTVERLNQIIHQSTLTSRFVSMVYGELERNGNFLYVNAGHPPPFLFRADSRWEALSEGGPVLGPLPDATYERGFVRFEPGDLLVMYTDGIIEAHAAPVPGQRLPVPALGPLGQRGAERGEPDFEEEPEEYGAERLRQVVQAHRWASAKEIVDAIFEDLSRFCGDQPPGDDRTVTVVRSPLPGSESDMTCFV
jgi:sigma-B regulation protein RsbU (phosphoserine phosphatase)